MELKPGYKQTEVGVIPEAWEVKELAELLEQSRIIRYGIVQPGNYDPHGCLMLRSQDYSKGWANPDDMHRVNSRLENQYRNARIHAADLIMTIVGAGIGQVEVAPSWLDGAILSRSTARIAVDEIKAKPRYISACLESPIVKRQIWDCQKEGAQPVVSCRDLAKFLVPYPSRVEQESIAEVLSDADTLIESLEQLIAKKRQIKQGANQELLAGKKRLPGFEIKSGYKKTEVGMIPEDWEVKSIGSFCDIVAGRDLVKADYSTTRDYSHQFPIYSNAHTNRGLYGYSISYQYEPNNITITARGDIGHAVFRSTRFCAIGRLLVLSSKHSCDLRFVAEYINNFVKFALESTGVPQLTAPQVSKYAVALPNTKAEQEAIADILSDMDAEITTLEAKLAKVSQIKKGMMQELLTGRIRLI